MTPVVRDVAQSKKKLDALSVFMEVDDGETQKKRKKKKTPKTTKPRAKKPKLTPTMAKMKASAESHCTQRRENIRFVKIHLAHKNLKETKANERRHRKGIASPRSNESKLRKIQELTKKRKQKENEKFRRRGRSYPTKAIGYGTSILNELKAREAKYEAKGIYRVSTEVCKTIATKKTRFVPSSTYTDSKEKLNAFYTKPTKLCCLWCTEPINGVPLPICEKYYAKMDTFYVSGQYCSPSCIVAECAGRTVGTSRVSLLPPNRMMLKREYGICLRETITAAPPMRLLKKFGGPMSIKAFRATGGLNIVTHATELPFLPLCAGIEEIEYVKSTVTENLSDGDLHKFVISSMNNRFQQPIPICVSQPSSQQKRRRRQQRGAFATLPTIEQQLESSGRRLRLEKASVADMGEERTKAKTLLDYMKLHQH